jgi:hypothetical protein
MSVFDLEKLYSTYFNNKPYFINKGGKTQQSVQDSMYSITENPRSKGSIDYTSKQIALNKINTYGKDIWFPIELWKSNQSILSIDACTIAVNLSKTIIKTVVSERQGTIKEQFSTDDYKFTVKGFLIGENRFFPEQQIQQLKELFKTTEPIELRGGYPEIFLDEDTTKIVMNTLDFPDVQGKSPWIRPFQFTCESDFIQDLIIK